MTAPISIERTRAHGDRLVRLALMAVALALAGCVSSRSPAPLDQAPSSPITASSDGNVVPLLRTQVARWDGTPHLLGGASANGMDCSAFVQRVYADAFQLDLPRTTEAQVAVGRSVSRSQLLPGDLVFFRPERKTNHVGIYLTDGQFAHVSSSEGVTVSEMSLPYWEAAYWTSRRILGDGDVGHAARRTESSDRSADAPMPRIRRTGW